MKNLPRTTATVTGKQAEEILTQIEKDLEKNKDMSETDDLKKFQDMINESPACHVCSAPMAGKLLLFQDDTSYHNGLLVIRLCADCNNNIASIIKGSIAFSKKFGKDKLINGEFYEPPKQD